MKSLICAIAAVALCGCTSPGNQARSAGAYKTYVSQKAEKVVAQCIEYAWQDEAMLGMAAEAFMQNGDKRITVYNTGAEYFADVQRQGATTTISYYAPAASPAADRRGAALATCL